MEAGGSCGAVVVHIVNGNLSHAELVKDSLATGGISVAVAGNSGVDFIIVGLRVDEGFDAGFKTEFSVVDFSTRFDELGHAYTEDVDLRGRH